MTNENTVRGKAVEKSCLNCFSNTIVRLGILSGRQPWLDGLSQVGAYFNKISGTGQRHEQRWADYSQAP